MHNLKLALALITFWSVCPISIVLGQVVGSDAKITISGRTMGPIIYNVTVAGPPDSLSKVRLQTTVQATLDRVNRLMSTYIEDSDVSRFNNTQSTEFQTVNEETAKVVARAIEISEQTKGAFDITVGPAVDLWNFGPDKREFSLPSQEKIALAMSQIGFRKLDVRYTPPAIRKTVPSLRIDLSAIAKGYAVDKVADRLDEAGMTDYMVEVGGEVMTRGRGPSGGKWRVGIMRPDSQPPRFDQIAEVSGRALATSGDYRNFVVRDGKRYSHTIDPESCRPVEHRLASACVIADDCMTADAFATAVMVMGAERGAILCKSAGYDYIFAERNSDFGDEFTIFQSPTFPSQSVQGSDRLPADTTGPANSGPGSIWPTFIAAVAIFAMVIVAMAVGSIFGNKPVQGSCGGLANRTNADGETSCGICSKPVTDCVEKKREMSV